MEGSAIRFTKDGDSGHVHFPERAKNAHGDLSPIGDQNFFEHSIFFLPSPIIGGRDSSMRVAWRCSGGQSNRTGLEPRFESAIPLRVRLADSAPSIKSGRAWKSRKS
jgi:hypothetical protein